MAIVTKWMPGFESLFKADPEKVADEIASIGESATPNQIVEKARDEASELHKCFTWDNTKAAEKWRLHEARQIVCHLVRVDDDRKSKKPQMRVFYKVDKQEGYIPVTTIFRQKDKYAQLLQTAIAELKAFQRKYEFLSDRKEIQNLIASLEVRVKENAG